jgi:hypothetical protein
LYRCNKIVCPRLIPKITSTPHTPKHTLQCKLGQLLNALGLRPVLEFAVRTHVKHHIIARRRTVPVKVMSLSAIIDKYDLAAVDLLKLDVESSDIQALNGVREEHWPRIRQVAMEVRALARVVHSLICFFTRGGVMVVEGMQKAHRMHTATDTTLPLQTPKQPNTAAQGGAARARDCDPKARRLCQRARPGLVRDVWQRRVQPLGHARVNAAYAALRRFLLLRTNNKHNA